MNLQLWKDNTHTKLRELSYWLQQQKEKNLPFVTYHTVAGLTLWTVVQTLAETGQWEQMLPALLGVSAGVGGNLVAEQLQRWKDRADSLTEEEVITVISEQTANADVRDTLDTLLQRLDVISQAQSTLSDNDRQWFQTQLRQELDQLGNLSRYETLIGDRGVYVQGNVDGSVITDQMNVGGDFVGRDKGISS